MIDWTEILLGIIGLIGLIITGVLVPYLKANTTEKQRENIDYWVKVAVIYIEKNYPNLGQAKKEDVTNIIKSMGLNINELQLNMLIDAVVEAMINNPYNELVDIRKGN